jgi:hypothetical protein
MTFWDFMTANPDALGVGDGLFGWLHFTLMGLMSATVIGFAFVFSRHHIFARRFAVALGVFMIASRVFRIVFRTIVLWHGGMTIVEEIIPWQICHIMCFLLGFELIFNNPPRRHKRRNKIYITTICYYAFFGNALTFLFGDYYRFAILSFYDIESILLHICLCLGWLYFFMQRRMEFSYTAILSIFLGMFVLVGYGALGNLLLAPTNPDINNMFIRLNGLPFSFFPNAHFLLTYFVLAVLVYGSAVLWLFIKRRKERGKK